jgi:hypothetical protein
MAFSMLDSLPEPGQCNIGLAPPTVLCVLDPQTKRPATEAEIQRLLAEGMRDPDPWVRRQCVGTVQSWVVSEAPEARAIAHRMLVVALRETEPAVVQPAA